MADCLYGKISIPKIFIDLDLEKVIEAEEIKPNPFEGSKEIVVYDSFQAINDKFEDLEKELVKRKIPFDRKSEGFCEIQPQCRYYRPATKSNPEIDKIIQTDNSYLEYITLDDLKPLLKLDAKECKKRLKKLVEDVDLDHIPPLENYVNNNWLRRFILKLLPAGEPGENRNIPKGEDVNV